LQLGDDSGYKSVTVDATGCFRRRGCFFYLYGYYDRPGVWTEDTSGTRWGGMYYADAGSGEIRATQGNVLVRS
jgi:hypothetical protein